MHTHAMLVLVLVLLWPSSSVSYTELAPQQYNNGSVELLHGTTIIKGPGNVHGGAGGGGGGGGVVEAAAAAEAAATVDAHIEALVDERDVASSFHFRTGALFAPEGTTHCQVH